MRVIASQKLPRDSGESIFAARHQDVSQGPLGFQLGNHMDLGRPKNIEMPSSRYQYELSGMFRP